MTSTREMPMSKPPQRPEHRADEDTEIGKAEKLADENKKPATTREKKEEK
jgi:hypothetical protein